MRTADEVAAYMAGQADTLNGLIEAGRMRRIKYARGVDGAAQENIRRAAEALESRERRHRREASEQLARRARRWELAGHPRAGKAARKLEQVAGGPRLMRIVRRAMK
jgi:hypothetical protein